MMGKMVHDFMTMAYDLALLLTTTCGRSPKLAFLKEFINTFAFDFDIVTYSLLFIGHQIGYLGQSNTNRSKFQP
jgi:hypothetical protein